MGAEIITEIFRTGENGGTFNSSCTIQYFNGNAVLQGLSGRFTKACYKEIMDHLKAKGIKEVKFIRHGKLRTIRNDEI